MPSILSKDVPLYPSCARKHHDNQRVICCCCGEKNLKCIPVTALLEDLIKKFVDGSYSINIHAYPTGKS